MLRTCRLIGSLHCLKRLQAINVRRNIHLNLSHGFVFSANTDYAIQLNRYARYKGC